MAHSRHRSAHQIKNKRRRQTPQHEARNRQPREAYAWLGAGAITLGIGAALAGGAGVGVAHADSDGTNSHTSSASSESGTSTSSPTGPNAAQPRTSKPLKKAGTDKPGSGKTTANTRASTSGKQRDREGKDDGSLKPKSLSDEAIRGGRSASEKPSVTSDNRSTTGANDASGASTETKAPSAVWTTSARLTVTRAIVQSDKAVTVNELVPADIESAEAEPSDPDRQNLAAIAALAATPEVAQRDPKASAATAATVSVATELVAEKPKTASLLVTPISAEPAASPAPGDTAGLRALALASVAAAVDPYVEIFKAADPIGQFYTPASPDQYPAGPDTVTITFDDLYKLIGSAGFSRDSGRNLRFTNNTNNDVGIMWGRDANGKAEGFVVLRPGVTATIPGGPSVYAIAQAPRIYAPPGYTTALLAVGGPDHPAAGVAAPSKNALQAAFDGIAQTAQRITNFVNQVLANTVRFVSSVTDATIKALQEQVAQGRAEAERLRKIAAFNLEPAAPWDAGELFHHLSTAMNGDADKIHIDEVQSTLDGPKRVIVYIGGTEINNFNQGFWANLPSYTGQIKQHQVDMINAVMSNNAPNTEIVLVGYSQGGLDAQNLAEAEDRYGWNVTTVVTYGTPITKRPTSKYQIIHFQETFDPIPDLGTAVETAEARRDGNIFERRASSTTTWNLLLDPTGMGVHSNPASYESVGSQFEQNNDSKFKAVKDNMKKFEGKIVGTYK